MHWWLASFLQKMAPTIDLTRQPVVTMGTLHPVVFSRLKQALSRNPLKKSRDALQAQAELPDEVLPHLHTAA